MDANDVTATTIGQLISEREASTVLGELGLSREMARRALRAGVAGRGMRLRGAVVYEEERVRRLLSPPLQLQLLPPEMQRGTFIVRAGERLALSQSDSDSVEQRLLALQDGWRFSMMTRIGLVLRLRRFGQLPLVATASGFVIVGGEIVDAEPLRVPAADRVRLILRPPGPWYDAVHLRRLSAPPGGAWTMLPHDALFTAPVAPLHMHPAPSSPC